MMLKQITRSYYIPEMAVEDYEASQINHVKEHVFLNIAIQLRIIEFLSMLLMSFKSQGFQTGVDDFRIDLT